MKELVTYQNGNTSVTILEDGTKTRSYNGIPVVAHPESIDIKITNYCDMGCLYCHESSTTKGEHGNLKKLLSVLSELPAGIELAIGGGNPLSHPELVSFLQELKRRGFIANITINQGHLKTYQSVIQFLIQQQLVYGIGISVTSNNFKYTTPIIRKSPNVVYHLIAGVNEPSVINDLVAINPNAKFLILGYKTFGFGVGYYTEAVKVGISKWVKALPKLIGNHTMSFDNLSIEQLNVRRLFTKEGWGQFYMGDDFVYTMYIDAVKQEYAPTSRSSNRKPFSDCTLLEYFKQA